MFIKKLFNFSRDYTHYLEKGEKYFADERYADARDAFSEALERIGDGGDSELIASMRNKYVKSGNCLGMLNLSEAEHAIRSGDMKKAEDHLCMVLEQAEDSALRKRTEDILARLSSANSEIMEPRAVHSCGNCKGGNGEESHDNLGMEESITMEDRVTLYYHSLPGDLPERYAGMGDKFARGCFLNLQGDAEGALMLFEEISKEVDNDILDYEKAIIYYHRGETGKCEQLLERGLELNGLNPLCHMGLVHLYTDNGRASEALPVLRRMIERGLIPEQARLMEGDLYVMLQDEARAVESYTGLLTSSGFAKEAAVRLIPLLEKQGRSEEAAYLAKKFAKGCC
ncbi:MAG TPA: hypothetical protein VMC44_03140 [Geobacteraceae bacterium]|nr:hypothetical protein [Geobacteraceae bacterium]